MAALRAEWAKKDLKAFSLSVSVREQSGVVFSNCARGRPKGKGPTGLASSTFVETNANGLDW